MDSVPSVKETASVPDVPETIWSLGLKVCSYFLAEMSTDYKIKVNSKNSSRATTKTLPKSPETMSAPKPNPTKNPFQGPQPD